MSREAADGHDRPPAGAATFRPSLSKAELVTIIDALLQAEMTLPLLDARNKTLAPLAAVRLLQLSLAERLEDLMAEDAGASVLSGSGEWGQT